jgi:hypothetical protein
MAERHDITIDQYAEGKCLTAGHYDTLVECSCGWSRRLSHGSGDTGIVGHRLDALEKAAGITTTVKGKARK